MFRQTAESVLQKKLIKKIIFERDGEALKSFRKYRCHPVYTYFVALLVSQDRRHLFVTPLINYIQLWQGPPDPQHLPVESYLAGRYHHHPSTSAGYPLQVVVLRVYRVPGFLSIHPN